MQPRWTDPKCVAGQHLPPDPCPHSMPKPGCPRWIGVCGRFGIGCIHVSQMDVDLLGPLAGRSVDKRTQFTRPPLFLA
jgi:hypothetical protein